MAETLREAYIDGSNGNFPINSGTQGGQSFTTTEVYLLTSVNLRIYRIGSPTGDAYVEIFAEDGGDKPTGAALASQLFQAETISDTLNDFNRITFDAPFVVEDATKYVIVVRFAGGDGGNNLNWRKDSSGSPYAGGRQIESFDSGSFWDLGSTTEDMNFEVWGTTVEDLVGHWTLDDDAANTVVVDSSFRGNDGVGSVNTSVMSVAGEIDDCFDFDGTRHVSVSDQPSYSFGDGADDSPFSVAVWAYVTNAGAGAKFLFAKWESAKYEWIIFSNTTAGNYITWRLADGSTQNFQNCVHETQLSEGWHLIVGTYDGRGGSTAVDGLKLYVDGSLVATNNTSSLPYTAMQPLSASVSIGDGEDLSGSQSWEDKLDDARIYSVELTEGQVKELFGGASGNAHMLHGLGPSWGF